MRLLAFATILLASMPVHAGPKTFTGVWSSMTCDGPDRCGGFVLYLVQDGSRLCGNHFYATMGAGRLNEGVPRSIVGNANGAVARVRITSGRDNSIYQAKLQLVRGAIKWQRLRQLKPGDLDEALIPEDDSLRPETDASYTENFEQVVRECAVP
jgi:hypothetical protein